MATAGARSPRTRLGSLRGRVVAGYVVLLALALLTVLLIARSALIGQYERDVDQRLAADVEQLEAVISEGDPDTGADFVDAEMLFDTHLRRVLPNDDGAFYTLVDGDGFLFSFDAPVRLLDDDELVASWADVQTSTFDTIATDAGSARVLVVPVLLEQNAGTFVAAAFTDGGRSDLDNIFRVLALVGSVVLLASALVAAVLAGRIVRPVRELTELAQSVTDADLSARIPTDSRADREIAELSETFNAMMDRLDGGFSSQRQFLDDVAHELRTPITIIQGHLDVLGDDPDERAQTVALLDDELARMNRYVDDLLVLAQAERPDFLRIERAEVVALMDSLLAKATGMGDRHWVLDEVVDADARLDPQRITQAVLNLAQNAVRHTKPGDEIGLSARLIDDRWCFCVRDTGPGVDSAILDELFDRHVRGAASRTEGGVGLGLSIVDAIAVAHGGRVVVESRPGEGSTFTIEIGLDNA